MDGTVCNITKHDWYTIHDLSIAASKISGNLVLQASPRTVEGTCNSVPGSPHRLANPCNLLLQASVVLDEARTVVGFYAVECLDFLGRAQTTPVFGICGIGFHRPALVPLSSANPRSQLAAGCSRDAPSSHRWRPRTNHQRP